MLHIRDHLLIYDWLLRTVSSIDLEEPSFLALESIDFRADGCYGEAPFHGLISWSVIQPLTCALRPFLHRLNELIILLTTTNNISQPVVNPSNSTFACEIQCCISLNVCISTSKSLKQRTIPRSQLMIERPENHSNALHSKLQTPSALRALSHAVRNHKTVESMFAGPAPEYGSCRVQCRAAPRYQNGYQHPYNVYTVF